MEGMMSHIFAFGCCFRPRMEGRLMQSPVQFTVRWAGTPDPWTSLAGVSQRGQASDFGDVTVVMPEDKEVPDGIDVRAVEEVIRSYFAHQVAEEVLNSREGAGG